MSQEIIKNRINNGVIYLNSVYPGWYNKIDLENINIRSLSVCILGQLYGNYCDAVNKLNLDLDDRIHYCFTNKSMEYHTSFINEYWKLVISNLRLKHTFQDTESILDLVPSKNKLYEKDFVINLVNMAMELGMTTRQNQLNGSCTKSGRDIIEQFMKDNL